MGIARRKLSASPLAMIPAPSRAPSLVAENIQIVTIEINDYFNTN